VSQWKQASRVGVIDLVQVVVIRAALSSTMHMSYASQAARRKFFTLALIALPFLLMGGYMLGIGLGWIPIDPSRLHAPRWVIAGAGLPFMGAGLGILGIPWISDLRNQMVVMLIVFAGILNWTAFSDDPLCFVQADHVRPRPRHVICQEDTGAPRLPLIAAAFIADLVIVAFVARDLRRHFKEPG
jgi:hypothetical protein